MRAFTVLGLFCLLSLSSCGYKEGIAISEQASYLYFTGDSSTVMVSIDSGEKFSVTSGRDHQYKITPGTHTVRVYRGESLIVERQIFLSDGVAKEIGVN